jgi:metal-responsive CopG/Arc/MetJ family transcriptional regulator
MTAKRVLISIDERLLSRIDQAVARHGLTRSGYLAQLASADLESESGPGRAPGSADALRRIGEVFEE